MAHIQGFHKRIKIRLRWYHGSWQFSDSQLEIKQKSGNLGTKSIFSIPEQVNLQNMDWHQLYLTINSHLPPGIQQLFRQTTPILINNYQREYYQSADQLIRLTLDTCIKSLDQTFGNRANLINYLPMRNYCVVELKAGTSHHLKIAEVLSEFPQYTSAFSKFLLGTETILPSSLG